MAWRQQDSYLHLLNIVPTAWRQGYQKLYATTNYSLRDRLSHRPSELSGGQQQRVAVARALASRPRFVLADEPTGNLDGANGAAIMDLLFSLQDEYGATLVLVTHDPTLADRCDRSIRLVDGKIAQEVDQ